MSPRAALLRLSRVGEGVVVAVLGGVTLVCGATWVEGGSLREGVLVCLRLAGALLVSGGTLGAWRARVRGEVGAIAAMGGGPLAWGLAGVLIGGGFGALLAAIGAGSPAVTSGWTWVAAGPGAWWLDGRPLVGASPLPAWVPILREVLGGAWRGALACALGVHVGLRPLPAGWTLLVASACGMAATLAG